MSYRYFFLLFCFFLTLPSFATEESPNEESRKPDLVMRVTWIQENHCRPFLEKLPIDNLSASFKEQEFVTYSSVPNSSLSAIDSAPRLILSFYPKNPGLWKKLRINQSKIDRFFEFLNSHSNFVMGTPVRDNGYKLAFHITELGIGGDDEKTTLVLRDLFQGDFYGMGTRKSDIKVSLPFSNPGIEKIRRIKRGDVTHLKINIQNMAQFFADLARMAMEQAQPEMLKVLHQSLLVQKRRVKIEITEGITEGRANFNEGDQFTITFRPEKVELERPALEIILEKDIFLTVLPFEEKQEDE